MRRSESRVLTTHTGSLPRPERLIELVYAREAGESVPERELEELLTEAVRDVVARQVAAGIDVVSDGEMSKIAFNGYAKDRLSGFGGVSARRAPADVLEHPDVAKQ